MDASSSPDSWLDYAVRKIRSRCSDRFEIYFETRRGLQIDARNQKIDSFLRSEDQGIAFRILRKGRIGFSFSTQLSHSSIDQAIESAIQVGTHLPEDRYASLFHFNTAVYPEIMQRDKKGLERGVDEKTKLALTLEQACRDADPRVTTVRSASYRESEMAITLVDDSGERIQYDATRFSLSTVCKAESKGEAQTGYDFAFSWDLSDLEPMSVGKGAAADATLLLNATGPQTKSVPVVLTNRVMGQMMDLLAPSFSAENIDKKKSMLVDRKGQRIASEALTLMDDGLYPGGYSSVPFDAEGIPSQKTTLIDHGHFESALYDISAAAKAGCEPTSSSSRSLQSAPHLDHSNLYIEPGKKSMAELMSPIEDGILITHLMGLHTANAITGDFSLGANGVRIQKGKLAEPVRGFAIAGNLLTLLQRVTEFGSDLRFFGSTGAPSAFISELSIGGR